MFYGLVLEGRFCLSPKSFSRIPLVRTQAEKEETPPAPQAPSIRISCSPTSSIHHSQTGRGRRKETSIASDVKLFFNFLQFLQKLSKDDTSCGKMSFLLGWKPRWQDQTFFPHFSPSYFLFLLFSWLQNGNDICLLPTSSKLSTVKKCWPQVDK